MGIETSVFGQKATRHVGPTNGLEQTEYKYGMAEVDGLILRHDVFFLCEIRIGISMRISSLG